MNKRETRSFLDQFDRAREEIKTWPKWMQDAARIASASFPKSGCTYPRCLAECCNKQCASAAPNGVEGQKS